MTENRKVIRVLRLEDQDKEEDLQKLTPEQRIQMVWPLTLDVWAFTGEKLAQLRLPRHVVRVLRP